MLMRIVMSCIKNKKELWEFIHADLYRYYAKKDFKTLFNAYFRIPGFTYMLWHRVASYYWLKNKESKFYFVAYLFARKMLQHFSYKYGIDIPCGTSIDKGFYIGHFSGIVVSGYAVIGKNVNISQGVTIGVAGKDGKRGVPVIGDNVYIAPGGKVIGKINIGNNAAIGANAVVTKDVEENSSVGGVPAKVISYNGSDEYILNKVEIE